MKLELIGSGILLAIIIVTMNLDKILSWVL
jgi:hypothetical protein